MGIVLAIDRGSRFIISPGSEPKPLFFEHMLRTLSVYCEPSSIQFILYVIGSIKTKSTPQSMLSFDGRDIANLQAFSAPSCQSKNGSREPTSGSPSPEIGKHFNEICTLRDLLLRHR
jgi:hypothetical protein